jgi:RNA polymerase sigma factor (sigma-70 family)
MTKLEKKETYEATLQLYHRYINTVAGKISYDYYEDLKLEGQIALWNAFNEWDESRGKFHTCAMIRIKYGMLNFMANNSRVIRLPINVQYKEQYKQDAIKMVSTDKNMYDDGDYTIGDSIETDYYLNDYDNSSEHISDVLKNNLSKLNDRHRMIISMRYNEDMTLKQIGKHFGITNEAVRQQLATALKKMKEYITK